MPLANKATAAAVSAASFTKARKGDVALAEKWSSYHTADMKRVTYAEMSLVEITSVGRDGVAKRVRRVGHPDTAWVGGINDRLMILPRHYYSSAAEIMVAFRDITWTDFDTARDAIKAECLRQQAVAA